MTLDEALTECVSGARMTAVHMQAGCYIEHSFSRGFLRCWPVARIEDEPNRTQCELRVTDADRVADWLEVERPKPVASKWGFKGVEATIVSVDEAKHIPPGTWGKLKQQTVEALSDADKAAALAAVGFVIPGAEPVLDVDVPLKRFADNVSAAVEAFDDSPPVDAPKRDSWGRPTG